MLADDLIRCEQLEGMSYREVADLLGYRVKPPSRRRHLGQHIGPTRDSLLQLGDEALSIEFDRDQRFESASIG